MTAIRAAQQEVFPKPRILLIDRRRKIGAKILISGGTRCNVTNREVLPSDYQGGPTHFVKHVLEAFTPAQTIHFFEQIGVPLVLEPTGKYFPVTHSGRTVLDALTREAERSGVELKTGITITEIKKEGGLFRLSGRSEPPDPAFGPLSAKRIVIATGGLSYPETGSDGTGYRLAGFFGHTVVETTPALTPLLTQDEDWKSLSGIALPVRISFFKSGKKSAGTEGPFLFTHFGFSGPASLDISRHWAACAPEHEPRLEVSFLPGQSGSSLYVKLAQFKSRHANKRIKTVLSEALGLPERFAEIFLKKAGVSPESTLKTCPERILRGFIHLLLNYPLEVSGVVGYKKAEVTAGGVDLREVNVSTMESKKVSGLYFAGEILDVDGRIGGFNFQWAWSSGAVAGAAAAKSL